MCIKGQNMTQMFNFGLVESFLNYQLAINPIVYLIYLII